MIRRYMAPLKAALVLNDFLSALALFLVLVSIRVNVLDGTWSLPSLRPVELAMAYASLWVAALWFIGLYRLRARWTLRAETVDVLRATLLVFGTMLAVLYLFDLGGVSRLFLVMLFVAQPAITIASRIVMRRVLEHLRSTGRLRRQMLIIGAGPEAEAFANTIERHTELGLKVMGHLRGPREPSHEVTRGVIGGIDQIEDVLHNNVVDEVAVCLSAADWSYVEPATRICEEEGKVVRVSMRALGGALQGGHYEELGDTPIVTFLYGPDRVVALAIKRLADVAMSATALIVLSPLLLGIALWIRLADGSPVIFRQGRVGLHGRQFTCLKFRTMVPDAEERFAEVAHLSEVRGPAFKIPDDPRITKVGRFLRRSSLDELPQLINVLLGEMSIVGPRPAPPREVANYSIWHRRRLMMRPGLTGYWQVEARSDDDFDRRAQLDLLYIDRWSLWMDFKIMLKTIPAMVSQQGR